MKKLVIALILLLLVTGCGLSSEMCFRETQKAFPAPYKVVKIMDFNYIIYGYGQYWYGCSDGLFSAKSITLTLIDDLCFQGESK